MALPLRAEWSHPRRTPLLNRLLRPAALTAGLVVISLVAAAPSYATLAAPTGFNTSSR